MVNLQGYEIPPIKNMAGVIPVVKNKNMLNSPYGIDALTLVGDGGELAIQKAILSAAIAGCETVWIVGREDSMRFIRDRVGEYIIDPKSWFLNNLPQNSHKSFTQKVSDAYGESRKIPIYYVQTPSRALDIRDTEAWLGLYGAYVALKTNLAVSNWLIPSRFFIISPYTIVADEELKSYRKLLRKRYSKYLFTHDNKTIYDGLNLPVTIEYADIRKLFDESKKLYTNVTLTSKSEDEIVDKMMNMGYPEYYSSFLKDEADKLELKQYYRIENWNSYREYISSDLCKNTTLPYYAKGGVFQIYDKKTYKAYTLRQILTSDLTAKNSSGTIVSQSNEKGE